MGQIGLCLVLFDCAGRLLLHLLLLKDQNGQIVFTTTLLLVLSVIIPGVEIVARSHDAYHIRIELFSFRDTQRRSSQTTSLRMLLRFSLQTIKHPNVSRHLMSWNCLLFQLLGVDAILFLERLLSKAQCFVDFLGCRRRKLILLSVLVSAFDWCNLFRTLHCAELLPLADEHQKAVLL